MANIRKTTVLDVMRRLLQVRTLSLCHVQVVLSVFLKGRPAAKQLIFCENQWCKAKGQRLEYCGLPTEFMGERLVYVCMAQFQSAFVYIPELS